MEATALVFNVSEIASQEIAKIATENNIENPMLRIRVVPGGCSGFQYAMGFDDAIEESDIVLESNGTKVIIDQFSIPYINGAELDYVQDFMGGGFTIKNPNNLGDGCSCGSGGCGSH